MNKSFENDGFMAVLSQSCAVLCRNLLLCNLRIIHENCGFVIYKLTHIRNLRICELGTLKMFA
jgi:hypothetical protein